MSRLTTRWRAFGFQRQYRGIHIWIEDYGVGGRRWRGCIGSDLVVRHDEVFGPNIGAVDRELCAIVDEALGPRRPRKRRRTA